MFELNLTLTLCGLDFETNGVDASVCRITEIGAALFQPANTEFAKEIVAHIDHVVYESDYPPQPEDIVKNVTPHLTDEVLKAQGIDFVQVIINLITMFEAHQWPMYFVAHNAEFDAGFLHAEMKRHKAELLEHFGGDSEMQRLFAIPFICSINDIPAIEQAKCRKLSHLAIDHKVRMDGRQLHKAIEDVFLLIDLLHALKLDWELTLTQARLPWVIVKAVIPKPYGPKGDGGKGKDRCKELKFRYAELGSMKMPETWMKKVKEDQIPALTAELGYPLVIIN